jgi:hypothetical protein
MKNRKLILTSIVFIVSVFGISLNAQSNKEEVDLIQSIFGMEKKAIVADFLGLENENAFWVLYDEYETTRKDLGKERLVLLYDYAENYDRLNDEKYDQLIDNTISLRKRTDKLMDQYYKKIKKVSGSKIAAQFFQLEAYFLIQIRAAIFDEIPYVGEFDE